MPWLEDATTVGYLCSIRARRDYLRCLEARDDMALVPEGTAWVALSQKDMRFWTFGIRLPDTDSFVDLTNLKLLLMTLQQQKGSAEIELKLPLEPRFRNERQHNLHRLFCYRKELKANFPVMLEMLMGACFSSLAVLWNVALVFVYEEPKECVKILAWSFLLCWLVPEVIIMSGKFGKYTFMVSNTK